MSGTRPGAHTATDGPSDDESSYQGDQESATGSWTAEPGRLFALTDGVFAIAMTLLALDVKIADSNSNTAAGFAAGRGDFLREFLVFMLAFFITGQFWLANHAMLRRVKRVDRGTLARSIPFLFGICSVPVAATLLTRYASQLEALAMAAGLLAVTDLLHSRLFWYVSDPKRGLSAPMDQEDRFDSLVNSLWSPILFLLAIPLSAVISNTSPGNGSYACFLWFGLGLDGTFVWTVRKILRRSRA
jgi:uncharacterized membrane protein